MPATVPNPFPLNIPNKVDSWEKLQLLLNIDPTLKLTAAEFNKILAALDYIYNSNGNPNNFLGTYTTYALFIAAHPAGQLNQYAFVYEDETLVAGTYIYIWNETSSSWQKETDTTPQGATLMNIQGNPFTGLASLFFRFDISDFLINQIQGGGISIKTKRKQDRHQDQGALANGTLTLDITAFETFTAVLTEATTIALINPKIKVVTLDLTGDFAITYPVGSSVVGDTYDGTMNNKIAIEWKASSIFITVTNY